jgi:polysaccharide deacetylase family protein (PEP-CTERM system associated)
LSRSETPHALTVDLEDWHQLLRRRVTGSTTSPSRHVVGDTQHLLDLLDEASARATFFVVGAIARAHPDLVREVARRGHEIGSHTDGHELIHRLSPEEFRTDVVESRRHLQDLTGQPVLGFRAPEFSVGHLGHWSFAVLAEAGYAYDSSVFPIAAARYGIPDAPRTPFPIETDAGTLWEFPLATWDFGGRRLPAAGGTYFRLLPLLALRRALHQAQADHRPAVLYFHPYEFHRGWLYVSGLSWRQRLHAANVRFSLLHNVGTAAVGARLRALLREFSFGPLGELYRRKSARVSSLGAEALATAHTTESPHA